MNAEDMQRFRVDGTAAWEDAQLVINCERCHALWVFDESLSLAELVQRAEEHTEVCQ